MTKRSPLIVLGWLLSGALSAFLTFVAFMEIMNTPEVQSGFAEIGFQGPISAVGSMLLLGVLLYIWKKTSVLGAILLTGYFGGAVCVHFMLNQNSLAGVPFLFGVTVWAGLWLRDPKVRALLPLVK